MDERLYEVEKQKQSAINQSNDVYNSLLTDNQNLYSQQQQYATQQETIQNDILDKQLNYQRQEIDKQKQEAQQVYQDEQKRAKNDYLAFNNPYSAQNEQMASNGLLNSGMSETVKLGGFNTYQNRLATANKAMQDAFTVFDSDLNEAIKNNDVQKAQNALAKLQMQQQYLETFYSNKSSIAQNQLSNNQALDSDYYNRYQTEYNNIQNEKAQAEAIRQWQEEMKAQELARQDANRKWEAEMAENQRQYNENLAYQKEQDALAQANWEKEYNLARATSNSNSSSGSNEGYSLSDAGTLLTSDGNVSSNGKTIIANPYTGDINPDAQYGVFDTGDGSGYQPNNVGGNKLSKSKYKVKDVFMNAYGSTGVDLSNQAIWSVGNKYYVWDGSLNDYIDVTDQVSSSIKNGINYFWGE